MTDNKLCRAKALLDSVEEKLNISFAEIFAAINRPDASEADRKALLDSADEKLSVAFAEMFLASHLLKDRPIH